MDAQGILPDRYRVSPRTLVFIRRGDRVLLMKRAPGRRIFPGLYNGVGGHVEAGEDLATATRREVREETGLEVDELHLAGLLHITGAGAAEGVLVAVFTAEVAGEVASAEAPGELASAEAPGEVVSPEAASDEGTLEWVLLADVPGLPLVPDLRQILPRLWDPGRRAPFFALAMPELGDALQFADSDALPK